MSDQLLEKVRDVAEGQIDFHGQRLAELLATVLLVVSGGISFIVGYFLQDIKLALYIGLAGAILTFIAIVPPWPFFNQDPVAWLPVTGTRRPLAGQTPQEITVDGKFIG